jgi:hypothetical protein
VAKYFLVGVILICQTVVAQQPHPATDARQKGATEAAQSRIRHVQSGTANRVQTRETGVDGSAETTS